MTHQDEEREDRVPIICHDVKEVPGYEVRCYMKTLEVRKTDEPHHRHGEAQFDTGEEEKQEHKKNDNADNHLIHGRPSRS